MSLSEALEEFYAEETSALDKGRYGRWLELLKDDFHYRVPIPVLTEDEVGISHSEVGMLADETYQSFGLWALRVEGSARSRAWSDNPPLRRRRFLGHAEVVESSDAHIEVAMSVLLVLHHGSNPPEVLSAERRDRLDISERLLLTKRTVLLDSPVIHPLHLRYPI